MIDFAIENANGLVYKENNVLERSSWYVIREVWLDKIDPNANFSINLGFSDLQDAMLFSLKFKGVAYE